MLSLHSLRLGTSLQLSQDIITFVAHKGRGSSLLLQTTGQDKKAASKTSRIYPPSRIIPSSISSISNEHRCWRDCREGEGRKGLGCQPATYLGGENGLFGCLWIQPATLGRRARGKSFSKLLADFPASSLVWSVVSLSDFDLMNNLNERGGITEQRV